MRLVYSWAVLFRHQWTGVKLAQDDLMTIGVCENDCLFSIIKSQRALIRY